MPYPADAKNTACKGGVFVGEPTDSGVLLFSPKGEVFALFFLHFLLQCAIILQTIQKGK